MSRKLVIGVIGSASPSPAGYEAAREVGRRLARAGAVVLCGGRTGVMEAVCRGAEEENGFSIGLLPDEFPGRANPYVSAALPTGIGHARNALIAQAAAALIAVEGGWGTLSEMALGLKMGKRVIGLRVEHRPSGLIEAADPAEAVKLALDQSTRYPGAD